MTVSIIHVFLRWVLDVFVPGTGKRRAGIRAAELVPAHRRDVSRTTVAPRLPAPRSPYGLDTPLDGADSLLVRPYLLAVEPERPLHSRRRIALALAADLGIDLDRLAVGAPGMGGGAR
ncbi:hypothetical protein ABT373_15665 [Streptomyces sp. NPDC000070]|uniref:hypothetical protein n=1 Tax=Streptomyces sp. NPDC000070 TaxID=3154240 RepID=UPI00331C38FD